MSTPATLGQRTRQREATRRELVDAGLRLVASNGFAATTTASIAHATGKAHGTVFVHFRSREALVAELIAEVGRVMSARLAPLAASAPSLAEVMQAHLSALADNEALYSRLLCEASTLPLAARAHIFALQSGIASRLRKAYARDRMQGTVREIDPVMLCNIWISLTNHYLMNRDLFAPGQSVVAKCGNAIQAQMLAFIDASPGATP
jgi:AcrR family transcriptional regulator